MRVRDIVRLSFGKLIEGGALPHYVRPQRDDSDDQPTRHGRSRPPVPALGLYADLVAWRQAVDFIRAFTATSSAAGPRTRWQVPAWGGSFGDMPDDELLRRLGTAFAGCGLRPLATTTPTPTPMVCFEATDSPMVSGLPTPYGRWLEVQEKRARWKERVDLRLVVCARARSVRRGDGRIDAFVDIALSAPAIELMAALATTLDRPPAPLAPARWLPRPLRVAPSRAHEGAKRDRIFAEGV